MALRLPNPIYFGPHLVTHQVFHITAQSFALVNLKPLLPGHVLVSPLRVVPRFSDLSSSEVIDLFLTVQRVSRVIERVFNASALNIAIQDGKAAGQSVPHVHAHVIPRVERDLDHRGGGDAIYGMMEGQEGDLQQHYTDREKFKFPAPDVGEERKPRSDEEMRSEAAWLVKEMGWEV